MSLTEKSRKSKSYFRIYRKYQSSTLRLSDFSQAFEAVAAWKEAMNDKFQLPPWIMALQSRFDVEQNRKYSKHAKLRKLKLLLFKKIHLTNGDGAGSGDLLRFSKKYQCNIWNTQWGIAQNATSMRRKTLNQPLINIPHGMISKRSCFNTENHV